MPVAGGVGFIKTIPGEFFNLVKDSCSLLSFFQKNLHSPLSHVLNGRQPITHGQLAGGHFLRSELEHGFIHIGRQDLNTHAVGFLNEHSDFVIVRLIRHQPAEEFHREVGLEIGRPVGNMPVAGGVGFIKTIPGEFFNLVKDSCSRFFINLVCFPASFHKVGLFLGHLRRIFLAHGAPQKVGPAKRIAGQQLGRRLHLFLVDHHAVGFPTDLFQQRMLILHLAQSLLHFNHFIHKLHGSRSVKSQQVNDVFNFLNPVTAASVHHTAGFQLENPHRISPVQQVQGFPIIQRDGIQFELRHAPAGVLLRIMHDGQCFQTQEVHLQKPHFINRAHVALGDDSGMGIGQIVTGEGHMLVQGTVTDHNTCRMYPHVADQAFQAGRVPPQFRIPLIRGNQLPQLLVTLVAGLKSHLGAGFDKFGNTVPVRIGHIHHTGYVPEYGLGTHGAIRNNVGNSALSVFLPNIINYFRPACLAKVNINIRRADAFRI